MNNEENEVIDLTKYENLIPCENYPIVAVDANQSVDKVYSSVIKILNDSGIYHNITS